MMASSGHPQNPRLYAELRPRKARTKTGCFPCRARRKKCDGQKPTCQSCVRLQTRCIWPGISPELSAAQSSTLATSGPPEPLQPDEVSSGGQMALEIAHYEHEDELNMQEGSRDVTFLTLQQVTEQLHTSGTQITDPDTHEAIFTVQGPEAAMLFDHFCYQTAPWLINGHSYDNPVLKFVVPLITKDQLVLQTVLSISGAHLLFTVPSIESMTMNHYSIALKTLRKRLADWVRKCDDDFKPLLVTIILLCHCEFIQGNTYGAALQHLRACQPFVEVAVRQLSGGEHQDFLVFLIEHYGYFMVISNLRCCSQEDNIRHGLEFVASILPLVKNYASFGSIFAFEPESFSVIPQIAQLAWDIHRDLAGVNIQTCQATYLTLLDTLNRGRFSSHATDGGKDADDPSEILLRTVFSLKTNTLLIFLHACYYQKQADQATLMTLIQPLADATLLLLTEVDEDDACYGLYWSILITGTYIRDRAQQEFIARKLQSNQSRMPFFTKGLQLLQWMWSEPGGTNLGLEGLEETAVAHGVEICIC